MTRSSNLTRSIPVVSRVTELESRGQSSALDLNISLNYSVNDEWIKLIHS